MTDTRSYEYRNDMPVPCMGGFCAKREHCTHYHSSSMAEPEERMCAPGADGVARHGAQVDASGWVRLQRVSA